MFQDWLDLDSLFGLDFLNLLTFLWLSAWAGRSFIKIAKGERFSILFAIIIHFQFCGVPFLMDVVFGKPEYPVAIGYYQPTRDPLTGVIYCLYVSMIPPIWWWTGRSKNTKNRASSAIVSQPSGRELPIVERLKPALFTVLSILLALPVLAWLASPNPSVYATYGVGTGGTEASASFLLFLEEYDYQSRIMLPITAISCIGAAGILGLQSRVKFQSIFWILPFTLISSWLNGKRNILVLLAVLLMYVFWEKGYLRGRRLLAASLAVILAYLLFSQFYQMQVRDLKKETSPERLHEIERLDYARDDRIKLAIYAEIHPEKAILDYRGQTFLYYLGMYIPRSMWTDKPVNYSIYATKAALETSKLSEWVVTTSILDEAIANFSWAGLAIGPLIVSLFCRIGDFYKSAFIGALTTLNAGLFLTLEFGVFNPLFGIWLIAILLTRLMTRKKTVQNIQARL